MSGDCWLHIYLYIFLLKISKHLNNSKCTTATNCHPITLLNFRSSLEIQTTHRFYTYTHTHLHTHTPCGDIK